MKISKVITEKEKHDLSKVLPEVDLDEDFQDDGWQEIIDIVQDKAIELLQSDDENAAYIDDIAAKISAYEY